MRALVALLVLMLVGCAPSPKKPVPPMGEKPSWQQHQKEIQAIDQWKAKGRLAVTQGKKGGNASFIWQQAGDRFHIKLHGPFGAGSVMISGNPHQVHAQEANGKHHQARTPEELMEKLVGWYVPVSGLEYWIRGIPVPDMKASHFVYNDQGYLKQFNQNGWTIRYDEYVFEPLCLPKRILLHNQKLKVKLIITSWSS